MSPAQGEIVDAEHGNHPDLRIGQGTNQPQQRVPPDRQPQPRGQPRPGPAGQRHRDRLQHPLQQRGAPTIAHGQPVDLLGERSDHTILVVAEESPDPQPDHHPPTGHGRISEPARIAAVHPRRPATTPRTRPVSGGHRRREPHPAPDLLNTLDRHACQVRQQNRKTVITIAPRT
jgi:hypothetical protein